MNYSETSLIEGTGAQADTGRWGDYTELTVDPTDGCTFWYTGQYVRDSGSFNWTTRIGSFRFPDC